MDIKITDAVLHGLPDAPNVWVLGTEITHDDGTVQPMAYLMPEDIFESRAAEHGIDPTDKDQLIEMVLFEQHLGIKPFDPAPDTQTLMKKIKQRKNGGEISSRNRADHEAPVATATGPQVLLIDAKHDPENPLGVLKREMLLDPDMIEVKRRIHRDHRRGVNGHGDSPLGGPVDYRARPTAAERLDRHLNRRRKPAADDEPVRIAVDNNGEATIRPPIGGPDATHTGHA